MMAALCGVALIIFAGLLIVFWLRYLDKKIEKGE